MRTPPARPSIDVDSPDAAPHGDGPAGGPVYGGDPPEAREGTDALWTAAAAVWRQKWWIGLFTVVAAGAAVAVALALPNRYTAEARVMLPETSGSSISSVVESVAPGASALLGAGGGDYTRYLAILTSRTVAEKAVERFGLVDVYQTQLEASPLAAAVEMYRERVGFDISLEYNYLGVYVTDESPQRSAAMANYLVEELNRENTRLTSESAGERRAFVQTRLQEAEDALDSVRVQIQGFQERYGVTEPSVQGEALVGAIGEASRAVAEAEVYYSSLTAQMGDSGENPDVNSARAGLEAARAQLARLTSGNNSLMPVPLSRLPQVGRQYSQLQQEQLTQAAIIEFIRPLYEQASFDERRESSAVQVIDEAIVPARKSWPKRSIIVLAVALSALVLACALVVVVSLLRRSAPRIASRLRAASA